MESMRAVMGTVLLKLQFFLNIAPVLAGCIIAPFTFAALQSYQLYYLLFACHK
jgi:hypothetical protein